MRKGAVGGFALAVILVVGLIVMVSLTTKVPAGYVAVQYDMNGGVREEVLSQGWHIVPPTVHTTLYTVGIEQSYLTTESKGDSKEDESFSVSSSENKAIEVDLTFTYQFNPGMVTNVFSQFKGQSGKEVRDSFIKPNIIAWSKEIISKYKVTEILGAERANINIDLTEYLAGKFAIYGIGISNVSLIDARVDQSTMDAINAKINAQQKAEQQSIENQMNIEKAEAEATAKITVAQADANAILIQAEAQAEANRMLIESLDGAVLQKEWIEKWNGELPKFVSGDSAGIMYDMGGIAE